MTEEQRDTNFCGTCGNEIRGTPNVVGARYLCNPCFMDIIDPKREPWLDDYDLDELLPGDTDDDRR